MTDNRAQIAGFVLGGLLIGPLGGAHAALDERGRGAQKLGDAFG